MKRQSKRNMQQAEQKASMLEQLKKMPIVKVACERTGVPRTTFYRWQEEDEEFGKAVDLALVEGKLTINDMSEYQLLSLIQEKKPGMIKLWLENHHPDYMKKSKEEDDKNKGPSIIVLREHEDTP